MTISTSVVTKLRFNQLRMLVKLSDAGSIRAAADAMNLTQPAVSRSLKDVEDLFGASLFQRSTNGLEITGEGRLALRTARLLLQEMQLLGEELEAHAQGANAFVRIGTTPHIASFFLPLVEKALAGRAAAARFDVYESLAGELMEKLGVGELDLLIILGSTKSIKAAQNARFEHEFLFENELQVIGNRSKVAAMKRVSLKDLRNENWILPRPPSQLRTAFDSAFAKLGLSPPTPAYQAVLLSSIAAIASAGTGLGIGLAPHFGANNLARVLIKERIDMPKAMLVYRRSVTNRATCATTIDSIRSVAANLRKIPALR